MSVLVVGASAASDAGSGVRYKEAESPTPPQPGDISVTILNTDTFAAGPSFGDVVAFFDSNESSDEFVAGHYVGAEVCASGSAISDVVATIGSPDIAAYTPLSLTENIFMYGQNEVLTRSLGIMPAGDCAVAYYYVLTPRFETGGAAGMTATFTISATGTNDSPAEVSDLDTKNIFMKQSIDAGTNSILGITTSDSF